MMKKALYMLAEFSDRDFDWLLTAGKRRKVQKGTVLIHEGEATDALYLVLDGTLGVSMQAIGGQEVARLSSGEVVGEMSFIDFRPPSATVTAIEDAMVWSIPRSQLAAKLMQDVDFAAHFYHAVAVFLSDRLRETVSRLSYAKEMMTEVADTEAALNPKIAGNLELAKARLDWLLNRLKEL